MTRGPLGLHAAPWKSTVMGLVHDLVDSFDMEKAGTWHRRSREPKPSTDRAGKRGRRRRPVHLREHGWPTGRAPGGDVHKRLELGLAAS
jgi:hypothetical protein